MINAKQISDLESIYKMVIPIPYKDFYKQNCLIANFSKCENCLFVKIYIE